jgi:hypothetical protein
MKPELVNYFKQTHQHFYKYAFSYTQSILDSFLKFGVLGP